MRSNETIGYGLQLTNWNRLASAGGERHRRELGKGRADAAMRCFAMNAPRWMALSLLVATVGGCVDRSGEVSPRSERRRQAASVADSAFLEQYAATRRFSAGHPTSIKITPDGRAVLFLRSGPRSFVQDLYEFDTTTAQERVLLTAEGILKGAEEQLSAEEKARRERMRVSARGITSYALSKDGGRILAPLSGRLFVIERASGAVTELVSDQGFPLDPRFSPDGRSVACVRDNELCVIDIATKKERRLTSGAGPTLTHGVAEFVAQEEMDRREGYWWSPDSRTLVYQQTSTEGVEVLHIADAMNPEAKPQEWAYPRAGKKNAVVRLGIISVDGGETRWIEWDAERYPYLAKVTWSENAPLTILVQNREQTEEALLAVEAATGRTTPLLSETDEAWVNIDAAMPKWLPDGSAFLWTTERRSSWQLEYRQRDGTCDSALTETDFIYKGFVDFDPKSGQLFVLGSDDPTQTHLYRVPLKGPPNAIIRLTTQPGLHGAVFSENHEVYVHTGTTIDGSRFQIVRRADGSEIGSLRSMAEKPPFMPKPEFTQTQSNPPMHAVIIRPRHFDAERRYPVLVSVYGGPHAQTVMASPYHYLLQQWMADHGFIVVSIDGRGTPSRGREWERIIKGDLIEIPMADQVAGLKALAKQYRELDFERIGVYGWSFGGYFSAMAVLRRPDVFDVGVAGAPVTDWLDYDTHYTERYMGLPDKNAEGYKATSAMTYAGQLSKPLMLIHGTTDDNVYFLHSLKLSNELFRAGKPHDFLPLSNFTHMVADPLVTTRLYTRIVSYFSQHLGAGR